MTTLVWQGVVAPILVTVLGTVLTAFLAWLWSWLGTHFKVQVEAKHREALHSALQTGVLLAIDKLGGVMRLQQADPSLSRNMTEAVKEVAVAYAQKSVPDAIDSLKPSIGILGDLAVSKLQGILGGLLGQVVKSVTQRVAP